MYVESVAMPKAGLRVFRGASVQIYEHMSSGQKPEKDDWEIL